MAAGTDDWLYSQSVELHKHLEKLGFNVKWVSAPGNHDWHFWDTHIQEVLDWLPLKE
jgi:enterochelin esterase-like enzyme